MNNRYSQIGLSSAFILVSACGAAVTSEPAHEEIVPVQSISPLLDAAQGGDGPGESYAELRESAVADCMHAKGWQYEPIVLGTEGAHESTEPAAMRTFRRELGYGLFNNTGVAHKARTALTQRHEYLDSLSNDVRQRFVADLGADSDDDVEATSGCRGQAEERMHQRYPATRPEVASQLADAHRAVLLHPAYLEAEQRWVACMDQQGFHYRDVNGGHREVSTELMNNAKRETAAARERAIGGADAECASKTTWPVQSQLEAAALQPLIARYGITAK